MRDDGCRLSRQRGAQGMEDEYGEVGGMLRVEHDWR